MYNSLDFDLILYRHHKEQLCVKGGAFTYNSTEMDRKTPTYGGYSNQIVVDSAFVLHVSTKFSDLKAVAPLLCAGITTYSPLAHWKSHVGPGKVQKTRSFITDPIYRKLLSMDLED
jgi:D-arabinose 1-dehydrogenase-like Zn-dependent alcohol dehydrogenase